jgi:hypothetical protein
MSRRKRATPAPSRAESEAAPLRDDAPDAGGLPTRRILRDVLLLAVVFGATVGIAELAGAANLGVSFGIGQVAFAIALTVLLIRE